MKKIIITSGYDPRESAWKLVFEITWPRMMRYAQKHGYDFKAIWYDDVDHQRFPEFKNPGPFVDGAVELWRRQDFIRWKFDRSVLAPNWLRYAAVLQLLDTYDLVVYMDGDLLLADMDTDLATTIPEDKWLAAPICGPNPPHDAGPGGPLFATRATDESRAFWLKVWQGKKWLSHPAWTDGVDFMDLLGFTTESPVHKVRDTEYDAAFYEIPNEWAAWGRNPGKGRAFHMGGGNWDPAGKADDIARIIREKGL